MEINTLLLYLALVFIVVQCVLVSILWLRNGGNSQINPYEEETSLEQCRIEISALRHEVACLKAGTGTQGDPEVSKRKVVGPPSSDTLVSEELDNLKLSPIQQALEEQKATAEERPRFVPAPAMNQYQPDFKLPEMKLHAPTYETMALKDLRVLVKERELDGRKGVDKQSIIEILRDDDRLTPAEREKARTQRNVENRPHVDTDMRGPLVLEDQDGLTDDDEPYERVQPTSAPSSGFRNFKLSPAPSGAYAATPPPRPPIDTFAANASKGDHSEDELLTP